MRHAWLIGLCLLLGACAGHTPVPAVAPALNNLLPLSLHVQRELADEQVNWLLVVQREGQALRWSLFNPLGVPLARQRLLDGAWHNDGLLPPNAEARELFAALLFALTPADALARTYGQTGWAHTADNQRRLDPNWRIHYRAPLDFTLNNTPGPLYRVTALTQE